MSHAVISLRPFIIAVFTELLIVVLMSEWLNPSKAFSNKLIFLLFFNILLGYCFKNNCNNCPVSSKLGFSKVTTVENRLHIAGSSNS